MRDRVPRHNDKRVYLRVRSKFNLSRACNGYAIHIMHVQCPTAIMSGVLINSSDANGRDACTFGACKRSIIFAVYKIIYYLYYILLANAVVAPKQKNRIYVSENTNGFVTPNCGTVLKSHKLDVCTWDEELFFF